MNEIGITTVQTPNRIIARRDSEQVGNVSSSEQRVLVTLSMAVSATGNSLSPFFICPR